ncbi:hypothetical protein [Nitrincola iocasae]|uniref:Phage protein n=1 Tax=Nitrincola iocasae TaxID=2614693 RepID=A0A5J6LDK9_9GAMM|nr:hypothetical protein [Nitrincola iocasae]QEW06331.1 hypothetical protein F5I99_07335 [Nitrincola iocasae]
MKNKLSDLNNHLFAQLERLSDEDLKGEDLTKEIERSRAVTTVSREIIANADLVFKAEKARAEGLIKPAAIKGMLSHDQ